VKIVLKIMPLAIWAFAVKMAADFKNLSTIGDVIIYIMSILIANAIQILIVIPLFLKFKKINPIKLFKNVSEGLNIAFMSKSSAVSMPVNIKCFEEKIVKKECNTTRFLFPLCTPLNMNSSSAFIATTVLFLMSYYGMEYSLLSKIGLLFVSTFVVMGNSTIPMATFILTTSFLANLNIPSEMMGIILPFYAMIDPIEATLNAWSDCAVVAAVKKEVHPDECSEL
jgi:Na+/H+-dicarboxylate symporter